MTLTLEQKIDLCNAVNTAVAKGHAVLHGNQLIEGMMVRHGRLVVPTAQPDKPGHFIWCGFHGDDPTQRIAIVKPAEKEIDVIYEPPSRASVASSQDLSESSP